MSKADIQMQRASGNLITWNKLAALRKKNKAVAMVGFSSRHRLLTPFDDPNISIWGLNRLHQQDWFKRGDVMFQIHPIKYLQECVGLSEGDREHYDWLTQEHPFPIYCQKKYAEFPSSVEYPIKEMRSKFGDFYTSTLAYMMALAIDQGYNHFELYGFDMEAETEYKHQRDSAEYFIGLAEGMGLDVFLPQNSALLKGGLGMYAYETTEVGFRQLLEGRKLQLDTQQKTASNTYNILLGKENKLAELAEKYPDLKEALTGVVDEREKQGWMINTINGARQEIEEVIRLFDNHYNDLNRELESGGEDGEESTDEESDGATGDTGQAGESSRNGGGLSNPSISERGLCEDERLGCACGGEGCGEIGQGGIAGGAGRYDGQVDRDDCQHGEDGKILGAGPHEVCGGDVQPSGKD